MSKWAGNNPSPNAVTPEKMEKELLRQIVDGRESNITFDEFPYYLRSHFIPFYLFPFLFLVLSIYLMIFSFLQCFCNLLLHGDQSSFTLCSTPFLLSLLQKFTSLLFFFSSESKMYITSNHCLRENIYIYILPSPSAAYFLAVVSFVFFVSFPSSGNRFFFFVSPKVDVKFVLRSITNHLSAFCVCEFSFKSNLFLAF